MPLTTPQANPSSTTHELLAGIIGSFFMRAPRFVDFERVPEVSGIADTSITHERPLRVPRRAPSPESSEAKYAT
jgi:hypothetical protein